MITGVADKSVKLLSNVTVIILAGGLGTRLQGVLPNKQKVLADVGGRPLLELILSKVAKSGFYDVVLALGYNFQEVMANLDRGLFPELRIKYSIEDAPLGTAGALRLGVTNVTTDQVLVLNGDSFFVSDFESFYQFHTENNADVSILLASVPDVGRYGSVEIDGTNQITKFTEKKSSEGSLINAGIYLMKKSSVMGIRKNTFCSLEKRFFPGLIGEKRFFGMKQDGDFIDIGTPESLILAQEFFKQHEIF